MKRFLAFLLIFVLCLSGFLIPAEAAGKGTKGIIRVNNGEEQEITVIKKGTELYFTAKDLASITGFSHESYQNQDYLTRHQKCLIADSSCLQIDLSWYKTITIPLQTIEKDGLRYYPGSVMLAWMNSSFLEEEGTLYTLVDAVSLWDFIEQFSVPDFDFQTCCQELNADSKWVKANSYLKANGFGAVMDAIPMGWGDNFDSYGEYDDYFSIFDGMVQNKESSVYGVAESLKKYAGPVKNGNELVEYILERFPDDIDKKLPAGYQALVGVTKLGLLADFGVYVQTLQEDNAMKLEILDTVDSSRWNFKDRNSVGLAAFSVADSYRHVPMGIVNRLAIYAANEGTSKLMDLILKNKWLDAVKTSVDFSFSFAGEYVKGIDFVDEYEIISNGAYQTYEQLKTSTNLWDMQDWVGQLYLYCYANEQNWRAMASYAQTLKEDSLAQTYLECAETCLEWEGKFLAAYPYLQHDASDYCTDASRDKGVYAEEIREIFARLDFRPLEESVQAEPAMFDLLSMSCEEIMNDVDDYEILNGFMIGCEVGNGYCHIELNCPQDNTAPDPDSKVTYIHITNEVDSTLIAEGYRTGMTLQELLPLFTPNIGLEEILAPEIGDGLIGSTTSPSCLFVYKGTPYRADFSVTDYDTPVLDLTVRVAEDLTAEEKQILGIP